jgi:hypothetical protein
MVSVSRPVPYDRIVKELNWSEQVAIVACNSCANYCQTGGRRAMSSMRTSLISDGFNVVSSHIVTKACILSDLRGVDLPDGVDTVLMMACVSGCRAARRLFQGKKVLSTNVTLGIGYYDSSRKGSVLVSPYPGYQDEVGKAFPGIREDGSPASRCDR